MWHRPVNGTFHNQASFLLTFAAVRHPLLLAFLLFTAQNVLAQQELSCDMSSLPTWLQRVISAEKPLPYSARKGTALHTNAFIGTWSIQKMNGPRYDFWSDRNRVVIEKVDRTKTWRQFYFIDLAANIRVNGGAHEEGNWFAVEDVHIPQAGYFRELWNDSVKATGQVEAIMDMPCEQLLGIDGNKDTTYYWSTDAYPALFADLAVWAPWLCREGDLEFLSALSDRNAGGSLRVDWPKRRFGPEAGSIAFVSITPGATPMPTLPRAKHEVLERRFKWLNNSGIGRLPAWMRACITDLPQHPLPLTYTPEPARREIPDNAFTGTFTAETPTMVIGEKKDTTMHVAKYSYWADARRAVLQLVDPDDEGTAIYMVDLDADVAIAAVNEGHSYVIPKLYVGDLEEVGLAEFGRGLEMTFTPTGKFRTMLGRKCELHTTYERSLSYFLIPTTKVLNPVFDMKNWLERRMSNKFKDVMFFGVPDKPMPMAVMGTHLTSYKPGKTKPPVLDLGHYQVRDQRIRERRERERDRYNEETIEVREAPMGTGDSMGMDTKEPGYDVAVPHAEEPVTPMQEGRWEDVQVIEPEPAMPVTAETTTEVELPTVPAPLPPFLAEVLKRPVNRFIGTATLSLTRVHKGTTTDQTIKYASTGERSVLISRSSEALPSVRNLAIVTHRKARDEVTYQLNVDSTLRISHGMLRTHFASPQDQSLTDTLTARKRTFLARSCQNLAHHSPQLRREAWVDTDTHSLFMDLFSARKGWDGLEHILPGHHLIPATDAMPLMVDLFEADTHLLLRVVDITPGPVDPEVFKISKEDWRK